MRIGIGNTTGGVALSTSSESGLKPRTIMLWDHENLNTITEVILSL